MLETIFKNILRRTISKNNMMLNMFEIRYVRISFGVHDQDEAN